MRHSLLTTGQQRFSDLLACHLATPFDLPAFLDDIACFLHDYLPLEAVLLFLPAGRGWQLVAGRDAAGRSLLDAPDVDGAGVDQAPSPARTGSLVRATGDTLPTPAPSNNRWLLTVSDGERTFALLDLYVARPLVFDEEALVEGLRSPLATVLRRASRQQAEQAGPSARTEVHGERFDRLFTGLTRIAQAKDVGTVLQLIVDFVHQSGWRRVCASLRDPVTFAVRRLASAGLSEAEHESLLQNSKDGTVWFERMGPDFERFRHGDWYYLAARDPAVQQLNIAALPSTTDFDGTATWHPDDMLYLPLRDYRGRYIGLVVIDDPFDEQAPDEAKMRPIQLFVRNAALLLDNHRLQAENARRFAMTGVIQELATLVFTALQVEDLIQFMAQQLVQRFDYPLVAVYLRAAERYQLAWDMTDLPGESPAEIDDRTGVVGRAIQEKTLQWAPDLSTDPDYRPVRAGINGQVVIPIQHAGKVLALLQVGGTAERPLQAPDREILSVLGEQLNNAIINTQNFNELEQHALQLATATEVSRRITSILNIDQMLVEVVQLIKRNFGYYQVNIFMHDRKRGRWVLQEGLGEAVEELKQVAYSVASDEGIVGRVGATGMSILAPDVSKEARYLPTPHLPETAAQLAVPMRLGAQVFGVLDVHSAAVNGLGASDQDILETLANQIAVALNNAQLFRELESQLDERERLFRASAAISTAQDVQELLDAIMTSLATPALVQGLFLLPASYHEEAGLPQTLQIGALWSPAGDPLLVEPALAHHVAPLLAPVEPASPQLVRVDRIAAEDRLDEEARAAFRALGAQSLVLIPVRTGTRVVGWLLLLSEQEAALEEEALRPFQRTADQAALVVERVQLLNQTQQRAERLAALSSLAMNISASLDLQKTLEDSVRAMAHLFRVRQSGLVLYEGESTRGRLVAQYREDGYEHATTIYIPPNPLTDELVRRRAPIFIEDVENDPLGEWFQESDHPRAYKSILVVPLLTRDRVIGSISLDVIDEERRFEPEEVDLAQTMAAQIVVAIENARLYEEATRRAKEMETASDVGHRLTRLVHEERLIHEVVQLLHDRFELYFVGIYLRSSTQPNRLELWAAAGPEAMQREPQHVFWMGQGLPGRVLERPEPLFANDVRADSRYRANPRLPETAAEAAIPLLSSGQMLGVLDLHSSRQGAFGPEHIAVLVAIADQIMIALQNVRLFAEQRETVARLQELDRLKSEFLASMSHELRTPLNSIIGFSKLLLRGVGGSLTETQEADLTSIFNSGQHLLSLINDILDLSKIVAGRMELNQETLSVEEVLDEVVRTLEPLATENSLRLEVDCEETLPAIRGDRTRVRQIMLNLLSNAIKFTEEGGIFVHCRRVEAPTPGNGKRQSVGASNGNYVEIAVRDTGIGIKREEQERIFEEFQQANSGSTRRDGGTGLGLAISRHLVEMHGGTLWLDSHYGAGSTFRFTLPVAGAAECPDRFDDRAAEELPVTTSEDKQE